MIVVLDTNIWLSELALNSPLGSAVRFFLKQKNAQLAVPKVVQLEVQHHLRLDLRKSISDFEQANRRLLALFGPMQKVVLPNDQQVEKAVKDVFTSLKVEMIQVPFSAESAWASFIKTVEKLSPSDRTQEFKDGVLWADCIGLLEQDDVLLATQDKAFYAERDYSKGLAKNLSDELKTAKHQLKIVNSIEKVLDHISSRVEIDFRWFADAVKARGHPALGEWLSRSGFQPENDPSVRRQLFATENPEVLYFKYMIEQPCIDLTAGARIRAMLKLEGDGSLKLNPLEITDVRPDSERVDFMNPDGTTGHIAKVFAPVIETLGHHVARHRLDDCASGSLLPD